MSSAILMIRRTSWQRGIVGEKLYSCVVLQNVSVSFRAVYKKDGFLYEFDHTMRETHRHDGSLKFSFGGHKLLEVGTVPRVGLRRHPSAS
jgi:hypothetical protein